ncbi:hypothetical protein [Chitinophaga dinghuensis]|nr:hypothetical protein [Chitinophaga dinghuensis]
MSYYQLTIKGNELLLSSKRILYITVLMLLFLPLTTLLFYKAIYSIYVHEPDKTKIICLIGFAILYTFLMIILLRRYLRDKSIVILHLRQNKYLINGTPYVFDTMRDYIMVEEKHNERRSTRYYLSIITNGRKIPLARRMDSEEYRNYIRPIYQFLQLTIKRETGPYQSIGIND